MRKSTKCPWCLSQMVVSSEQLRHNGFPSPYSIEYRLSCSVCESRGPIYYMINGKQIYKPSKKRSMSVHDETWDKCRSCRKVIKDWNRDYHEKGYCQKYSWEEYSDFNFMLNVNKETDNMNSEKRKMSELTNVILENFGASMCHKIIVASNFPIEAFSEFLEEIKDNSISKLIIKRYCCRIIFEFGEIVFLTPDENRFRGYRPDLIIFAANTRFTKDFLYACHTSVLGNKGKVIVL